ncbi:hypothetical protein N8137_01165 [Porticoccaceae bacterium]|jgi:hypothetical protein|nr:hypothetical protein [Porticoccaceae bacterium]MDB4109090.1 hypothetical protein [Porticoccaceae bacterium]MDC0133560.1 hypothetical protein [Porticoccaceae bacterium]MDC1476715.1 hypothetical protein [Porticoccaceae bacterium]|tara:strand:+ start:220 stop:576 length:357 start_codon:yes stop_codon:yes gene_type:complete
MDLLITIALSFCLILLALLVFRFVGLPVYRVEAINIKTLLEAVLQETATVADWDVFMGMPIRQDPDLDEIRLQCAMLASSALTERAGLVIFSSQGREQLAQILDRVNSKLQATEHNHD